MVVACCNGDEALALLGQRARSRRWRALLDYRLADPENGIRLAERIRQAEGDDIVILEVMTDDLDRAWWGSFRKDLERRFRQESVIVRALTGTLL